MKKIIFFVIILFVGAWVLQNYTNFKAIDLARGYYQKIDWNQVSVWMKKTGLSDWIGTKDPAPKKSLDIFIKDNVFSPDKKTIQKGAKVTWYNEDTKSHTITGSGWGSPELLPGEDYSKAFDLPGTYAYHCSLYPSLKGELIISE